MNGISICIVNFNGENYLEPLLESIENNFVLLKDAYEILIVDNSSTDRSFKIIEDAKIKNDKILLFLNQANEGFGKANNKIVSYAKFDTIMLLNNDTKIIDLSHIIRYMNENKFCENQILSCTILNPDRSKQKNVFAFPVLFKVILELFLLKAYIKRFVKLNNINEIKNKSNFYFSGCFFIISKSLFNSVNGFNEQFTFYHEEADLFMRMKRLNPQKIYFKNDKILHYGGGGNLSEDSFVKYYLNLYRLFYIHINSNFRWLLRPIFLGGLTFRILLCLMNFHIHYSPFDNFYKYDNDNSRFTSREIIKMHMLVYKSIKTNFFCKLRNN